jgi:gliding motility-associated protein GldE
MSAFVSGSEIAFFGLTPQDIEELEENQDDDNHSKAFNLISQSERLLATILISNNLVNVTLVILLSFAISQTVVFNSPVVDFLLQTVFLTFLLLLFGEIFPKLVAKGRKKKWALFAAGPLTVVYNIVGPLAKLMARSTTLVNRVITKRADSISTDELSQALEISDVKSEQDKEMLEGILSFGEKEVSEIMVSRIDVTDIDWNSSWSEVVETILQSGFSRIPVYDKTQDNIKGVLYSKDLIPYIGKRDDSFKWQNLLRPAFFIPESKMIDDLLEDFRRKKTHIAIVVDEYGCTQGIVTLEDILEEIVGDIDDEYDEEDKLYQQLSEDTYVFEAKISLSDFCRVTGVEEEEFGEIGEVETLAGLILSLKGDFPTKNESVVGGRCRFLVLEIRRHRIISVRVKVMSEIQSDASNPED